MTIGVVVVETRVEPGHPRAGRVELERVEGATGRRGADRLRRAGAGMPVTPYAAARSVASCADADRPLSVLAPGAAPRERLAEGHGAEISRR